ncbi:uncharacterized protein LOC126834218 [Adelges cooleyi]|uniref:uncharacterized protein LOC126834218 n=1 Tax=Adelges cooleyi TaxID=133065 RepID=UPI002180187A|nr:uncharacterized protein LOC126834218 [Adelges cooleyi]XP_050421948.1 uncharacterized protein LOC126834218 [Adelges cooleyi]
MKKNKPFVLHTSTLVVLLLLIKEPYDFGEAVKMLGVKVPAYIFMGDSVQLFCNYDMQMDKLYSVTWYKDNEEFYRFVPSSKHLKHSYNMDGITVDHAHSDSKKVTLRYANLLMNGEYKCEVSAEAPFFTTVHAESKMAIVSLPKPKDIPKILGGNDKYQSGDMVYLNCTSGRSYPAAKLRWYVNNNKVMSSHEHTEKLHNGLFITISRLNLSTTDDQFHNGKIKVTCQAVINIGRQKALPSPKEYKHDTVLLVVGSATTFRKSVDFKVILLTLMVVLFPLNNS